MAVRLEVERSIDALIARKDVDGLNALIAEAVDEKYSRNKTEMVDALLNKFNGVSPILCRTVDDHKQMLASLQSLLPEQPKEVTPKIQEVAQKAPEENSRSDPDRDLEVLKITLEKFSDQQLTIHIGISPRTNQDIDASAIMKHSALTSNPFAAIEEINKTLKVLKEDAYTPGVQKLEEQCQTKKAEVTFLATQLGATRG